VTAELLRQTLDALGLDRVRAVGGSIGNLWVLRLAQAHRRGSSAWSCSGQGR
jgi:pimeloyl-ACP methyl ester carboxylesterase